MVNKIHLAKGSLIDYPKCKSFRVTLDNWKEKYEFLTKDISKVTCGKCKKRKSK